MNTATARKIVKDNSLRLTVKGRTNGIIKVWGDVDDLDTLNELLLGMGHRLNFSNFPTPHYTIERKK